jgi:hypothetical protein
MGVSMEQPFYGLGSGVLTAPFGAVYVHPSSGASHLLSFQKGAALVSPVSPAALINVPTLASSDEFPMNSLLPVA